MADPAPTAKVFVTDASGIETAVQVQHGLSLMEALRSLDLGVGGECEGSLACATCHVWVQPDRLAEFGEASEAEAEMLDCAFFVRENSRLCCQLTVSAMIEGLRVQVPHK